MEKLTRRLILKPGTGVLAGAPALEGVLDQAGSEGTSRRAFLQGTAGAAAGAAAILATPKVASIALDGPAASAPAEPKPVVSAPAGPVAREPVTAYVRDVDRGEVTVMFGERATTYRDPALVKRLIDAAR